MQYDLKMCRICAKIAKTAVSQIPLFERSRKELLRRIALVTGVTLRNSKNLPQQICIECETDLQQSYAFRERCINAQAYFASAAYKKQNASTKLSNRSSIPDSLALDSEVPHVRMKQEQPAYGEELIAELPLPKDQYKQLQLDIEFEKEPEIYFKSEPTADESTKAELLLLASSNNDALPAPNAVVCDEVEMPIVEQATAGEQIIEEGADRIGKPTPHKKTRNRRTKTAKNEIDENEHENGVKTLDQTATVTVTRKRRKHTAKKERIFICDQCGNNFKCRQHLQTHLKRHAGIKPYQCEVCPDKFFTHSELTRHMRRHTGERPFACKYCERRFTDYSTRVKHERTHTNERPFACNQCGKAFTTSYILKNHMLVHTGERSFECTYCARSFQRQTHLIVHNRSIMHQQNFEKAQQELSKQTKTIDDTIMRLPVVI